MINLEMFGKLIALSILTVISLKNCEEIVIYVMCVNVLMWD